MARESSTHDIRAKVIESYFNNPAESMRETAEKFDIMLNEAKYIIQSTGRHKRKRGNWHGEIIREFNKDPNQTQRQIAAKIGVTYCTVSNVLTAYFKSIQHEKHNTSRISER